MTYREFQIPKKSGGYRKITAPDEELLTYQRSKLPELEQFWQDVADDHGVEDVQHGFIKDRNCVTAASKHIGYRTTISMDIADFFDTVTTKHISKFSFVYAMDPHLFHKDGYCSQGFATSPILCNIALIPAIQALETYLDLVTNSTFALTVYADDITVSCNIEDHDILNEMIVQIEKCMLAEDFKVKPTKTRIRYAKFGFRRVLGVMVGATGMKVPRKIKYRLRAARHQAETKPSPQERQTAGNSAGGLMTWSMLHLPKALR